ncbi:Hypothetical predicted protein, partial [Mytilus galloprovincialis]
QCMLTLVTTFFGYFLIGTVTISQIPQILKILRRRNASGVSFCVGRKSSFNGGNGCIGPASTQLQ